MPKSVLHPKIAVEVDEIKPWQFVFIESDSALLAISEACETFNRTKKNQIRNLVANQVCLPTAMFKTLFPEYAVKGKKYASVGGIRVDELHTTSGGVAYVSGIVVEKKKTTKRSGKPKSGSGDSGSQVSGTTVKRSHKKKTKPKSD